MHSRYHIYHIYIIYIIYQISWGAPKKPPRASLTAYLHDPSQASGGWMDCRTSTWPSKDMARIRMLAMRWSKSCVSTMAPWPAHVILAGRLANVRTGDFFGEIKLTFLEKHGKTQGKKKKHDCHSTPESNMFEVVRCLLLSQCDQKRCSH